MKTKHTSLTASRIISKALPELESEKWWVDFADDPYEEAENNSPTWVIENTHIGYRHYYRAYTFQELIDAIQLLGEKCGWPDKDSDEYLYSGDALDMVTSKQYKLFAIYLKTKDLSSEEVDSFIRNTFEV